jgi:hypothetical protein
MPNDLPIIPTITIAICIDFPLFAAAINVLGQTGIILPVAQYVFFPHIAH